MDLEYILLSPKEKEIISQLNAYDKKRFLEKLERRRRGERPNFEEKAWNLTMLMQGFVRNDERSKEELRQLAIRMEEEWDSEEWFTLDV